MPKMKQISIDVDVNRVIESNRMSFTEVENDILRRLLLKVGQAAGPQPPKIKSASRLQERVRGDWVVEIEATSTAENNLKASYCSVLEQLERRNAGFLQKFSLLRGRTRRFVARAPHDLYETSKHLADDHAVELVPGWYVDTNLSEQQVAQRVRAAAEIVGLNYGTSLAIREGGRLI